MKKLIYWLLMLALILSIGYLFQETAGIYDRLAELEATIHQEDAISDRLSAMEQKWEQVYGQIPAGADAIATPTAATAQRYADDDCYPGFYGRLYIPDAEIDVALYCGSKQYITDRVDSANLFTWREYTGKMIADHNNQDFVNLFRVEVGMTGYIWLENGDIVNIECVDVLNGHNTVYALTDEFGFCVMSSADYVMYTCRDGWQNVRICLWDRA